MRVFMIAAALSGVSDWEGRLSPDSLRLYPMGRGRSADTGATIEAHYQFQNSYITRDRSGQHALH
jgi:hypothetical protein